MITVAMHKLASKLLKRVRLKTGTTIGVIKGDTGSSDFRLYLT